MAEADKVIRIAMWSGPRNISTAMMRSWENRADTAVVDEPFYACFLRESGIIHPMQDEVMASQSSNWGTVISKELQADLEAGQSIQYQKHMTHHMLADIDHDWFASVRHAFLIRDPAEVVASYAAKRETVTAEDVGFAKQKELYDAACDLGEHAPPVIDARDVLQNPRQALSKLCAALNVDFDRAMLNWPAGKRDSDGAWAPHWYQNVERSTQFGAYRKKDIQLSDEQTRVVDQSRPYYQSMYEQRIHLNQPEDSKT